MDAQQAFLVAEIKNLNEQIAKLQASLSEAEGAMRSLRATPVPPESRPAPRCAAARAVADPSRFRSAPIRPPPAAAPAPPPRLRAGARARAGGAALAQCRGGPAIRRRARQAARRRRRAGRARVHRIRRPVPAHPQAAAAQNHIGEAYYRQRDYRQAMAEFQKTVDGYTQAAQVSEALLKIGLCQRALGDAASAKASWEQVIKQFPKSDAARQARTLLAARPAAGQ